MKRFSLVLIKPTHYDDDGYPIQWLRSAIPSNTLAVLNSLALDCRERRVLGNDVEIDITLIDETNTRVRLDRIARQTAGVNGNVRGLVAFVGVQSNQYPRAMDMARVLRKAGVPICIGGFHVSGCLSMLPEIPPELKEAMDLGVSLFAGEAEGRLETVLRDAWNGALKPLYNYMDDLPSLEGATLPMLPVSRVERTGGSLTSFDAGRGCPFQCSFCTIINVQGRKSRRRSADDVEEIIRRNLAPGINRFFITDDNFARNADWEKIFDRIIELRETEKLNIKFVIQVDTMCHRLPKFVEKAGRAGVVRVFIGLENINPDSLSGARKKQNKITEYRKMLLAWKAAGVTVFAGYILGFPNDTPDSIRRDIGIIQRELPIDLLEFHCLTPLPGSEDHQRLHKAGTWMEPDLNKYDLEHATMPHPLTDGRGIRIDLSGIVAHFLFRGTYEDGDAARGGDGNQSGKGVVPAGLVLRVRGTGKDSSAAGRLSAAKVPARPAAHHTAGKSTGRCTILRCAADLLGTARWKHVRLGGAIWRQWRFREQLRRDPEAAKYMDAALTPVAEEEFDSLELFTVNAAAKSAVEKARPGLTTIVSAR